MLTSSRWPSASSLTTSIMVVGCDVVARLQVSRGAEHAQEGVDLSPGVMLREASAHGSGAFRLERSIPGRVD